jgi:hypothetical protein
MGAGVNDRRNNEVRRVLGPFIDLVSEFGMTMLGVTHFGKGDAREAVKKILDSVAYANLARAIHYVARDPDNAGRRLFMPGPGNYAPADLPSLAFELVEKEIPADDGEPMIVVVPRFLEGTVDINPDDVLNVAVNRRKRGPKPVNTEKLAIWLHDYLKAEGRPVQGRVLFDAAGAAFANEPHMMGERKPDGKWSNGTNLYRAVDLVPTLPDQRAGKRVEYFQEGPGKPSFWQLVDAGSAY